MAWTQRQSEYIVMVKTRYECQPEPTCRHPVPMLLWSVARKCCSSQVPSVVCGTWDVQRVGCCMVWQNRARCAARKVTVHRLSAYSQDLWFTAHLHESRLYPKPWKEWCTPSMKWSSRPVLSSLAFHAHSHGPLLGLHSWTLNPTGRTPPFRRLTRVM